MPNILKNPKGCEDMGKKRYIVNGRGEIDEEGMKLLKAIVQKAKDNRDTKIITEIIKNDNLSKVVRQQIAILYFKELREITKRVFFKSTLKKLSKAIRMIELSLEEQGLTECSKHIRREWDKWIQQGLWAYLKNQKKLEPKQQEKPKTETEILKSYL